jgi:hypothetical protein
VKARRLAAGHIAGDLAAPAHRIQETAIVAGETRGTRGEFKKDSTRQKW